MCECATCGVIVWCGHPACVESECLECRDIREEIAQAAAVPDTDPEWECLPEEGQGRR
jgi:hypothetical protein